MIKKKVYYNGIHCKSLVPPISEVAYYSCAPAENNFLFTGRLSYRERVSPTINEKIYPSREEREKETFRHTRPCPPLLSGSVSLSRFFHSPEESRRNNRPRAREKRKKKKRKERKKNIMREWDTVRKDGEECEFRPYLQDRGRFLRWAMWAYGEEKRPEGIRG